MLASHGQILASTSEARQARTKENTAMNYRLEIAQEADGRWLAEVPELPGVLAYGASSEEAMAKA